MAPRRSLLYTGANKGFVMSRIDVNVNDWQIQCPICGNQASYQALPGRDPDSPDGRFREGRKDTLFKCDNCTWSGTVIVALVFGRIEGQKV